MYPEQTDKPCETAVAAHDIALPLRRILREQIRACCVTDDDLNAFILDYFPEVYKNYTRGMTREAKVTILLENDQLLPYAQKALAQIIGSRTGSANVVSPMLSIPTAPRPRYGEQELEVCLEEDFKKLSPEKLVSLMHVIRQLIGQQFKVVLRDCRAGSIILTLRGDWRALTYLMDEFECGHLRTLSGFRIHSIQWVDMRRRIQIKNHLYQIVRFQMLRIYLIFGWLIGKFNSSCAINKLPQWAIVFSMICILSGLAWATKEIVHIAVQGIIKLTNDPKKVNPATKNIQQKSKKVQFANRIIESNNDLMAPLTIHDMASADAINDPPDQGVAKKTETHIEVLEKIPTEQYSHRADNGPNQKKSFMARISRNVSIRQYNACRISTQCMGTASNLGNLAAVHFSDAISFCKFAGGRLLTKRELLAYGSSGHTHLDWTQQGEYRDFLGFRKGTSLDQKYIRCIDAKFLAGIPR